MKDKKGQVNLGLIMVLFITILIGVIFVQVIAQSVGESTNTIAVANYSLGVVDNDTTVYLTDYRALSSVVVYNNTEGIVPATNYTVTNNVIYNGDLAVSVVPNAAVTSPYHEYQWNISGTAQPVTYISDSGGRAMAALIVIMFALAVAVVAISPTLKEKILG